MANWSNPLITTNYDVFVNEAKDRDVDAATMFVNPPTNQPVGSMKYNRGTNVLEEWNGSAWVAKVIGVTGGGTGASSAGGAVSALGLGTMALQNSNAVTISWGQATLYYLGLHGGIALAADGSYDLGSNTARWGRGYFRNGLVIPTGFDKFATS